MLDVPGIFRWLNRRDYLVENDFNRSFIVRGNTDFLRCAVEIAGRAVPLLSFATIHRQLDGVPIRSLKRFIAMQQTLHPVVSRLQFREAPDRVPKSVRVYHGFGAWP